MVTKVGSGVYLSSLLVAGINVIVGLFTSVLVARMLGPLERGELADIMFIAATTTSILMILMPPRSLIWRLSRNYSPEVLGGAVMVIFSQTILVFATVPLIIYLFHRGATLSVLDVYLLATITAVAQVIYNGLCALLRARAKFGLVTVTILAVSGGYLIALLFLLLIKDIKVTTILVANTLPVWGCAFFLWFNLGDPIKIWSKIEFIHYIKAGWKFLPLALFELAFNSADRALILKFANLSALGFYVVAASVTVPLILLAETIVQISFVEVTRELNASKAGFLALHRFRLLQVVITILGIGIGIFGPMLVPILFGSAYMDSIPPLLWLTFAMVLRGQSSILNNSLQAIGHTKLSLISSLIGLFFIIFSGYILIPKYQETGAAESVAIGYIAIFIYQVSLWHYKYKFSIYEFWGFKKSTFLLITNSLRRYLYK